MTERSVTIATNTEVNKVLVVNDKSFTPSHVIHQLLIIGKWTKNAGQAKDV